MLKIRIRGERGKEVIMVPSITNDSPSERQGESGSGLNVDGPQME